MKAYELTLGDYVQVNGEVYKVISISYFDIGISDSKEDFYHEHIDNVKPIPLTAEILEKNGFIIKKKWAQIGNFGDSPLIMWHFADDYILGDYNTELEVHQNDTGKVHVSIPCKYVHELQHILRFCKINKIIEL